MNLVEVRTYKGRTQQDAAKDFAKDARKMADKGYTPVSQSWADGRSGVKRFIALGGVGALVFKPEGTLTVTYRHEAPQPSVGEQAAAIMAEAMRQHGVEAELPEPDPRPLDKRMAVEARLAQLEAERARRRSN